MNEITKSAFASLAAGKKPVILDGGLATELESRGFDLNSKLWSAEVLVKNPEAIVNAHLAYLNAGAQIITTASYQASLEGYLATGFTRTQAKNIIVGSVDLASRARDRYLHGHPGFKPLIAASIGPYGAFLADGSEYSGHYAVDAPALYEFHRDRVMWLDQSDADVLACETIPSIMEAKVLHDMLLDIDSPAWISFSCRDGKHLNDGSTIHSAVKLFANHPAVLGIGINCTSPRYISQLIHAIKQTAPLKAIIVYPNSGETYEPASKNWKHRNHDKGLSESVVSWHKQGASILGGCCRVGPKDIFDIAQAFNGFQETRIPA